MESKKKISTNSFKNFPRVHAEASQRQIGSGLGLWISKTLAELMGGNIKAYSKPNVGTTFVLVIRADHTSPSIKLSKALKTSSGENRNVPTQRVLLVDDDPYNLETHFQLLKSLGYTQIDTAIDGYGLVSLFKSKPESYYQLILTDINMPGLNGVDAVRQIREFEKSSGRVFPVYVGFVTGHSNNKDKLICEGEEIKSSFYLSKPMALSTLRGALQTLGMAGNNIYQQIGGANADRPSLETNLRSKPLVLCVDDDILNLEIFEDLIADLGATSVRATSGEEAIKMFSSKLMTKQPFDLVLIDCLMSDIDGWTASAEMKKLASNIPVIGVTGVDVKRHETKFKDSRMNEVLRKPVIREELGRIINKYTMHK